MILLLSQRQLFTSKPQIKNVSGIHGLLSPVVSTGVEKTVDISEQLFIIIRFCRNPQVAHRYPLKKRPGYRNCLNSGQGALRTKEL
jgi:hypothetical protein